MEKNKKSIWGKIILILSVILIVVSIIFLVRNINNNDDNNSQRGIIYEVDNTFKVSSPLGFNGPFDVEVYGIVENRSDEKIEDVTLKVYYYDTNNKRQTITVPTFDVEANSEYTVEYTIRESTRAFHVDKVEYTIGTGSVKTLTNYSNAQTSFSNSFKIVPFIFLIILGIGGAATSIVMMYVRSKPEGYFDDIEKSSGGVMRAKKNTIQMVTCQYCGTENKVGASKCISCGSSLKYDK